MSYTKSIILLCGLMILLQPVFASEENKSESKSLGEQIAKDVMEFLADKGLQIVPPEETGVPGATEELIVLNFNNLGIDQILQFISQMTGKAIIKSDDANGSFTIMNPNKVTKKEALDLIEAAFAIKGITIIETDNLIKIVSAKSALQKDVTFAKEDDKPSPHRITQKVIYLENALASTIKESLTPLVPETSNIIADDRTNTLVITDTGVNIERFERIIKELDRLDQKGELITKIYPLTYASADSVARNLDRVIAHYQQASEPKSPEQNQKKSSLLKTKIFADGWSNALIVSGSTSDQELISELIKQIDVSKKRDEITNIITLKYAEADTLANELRGFFSAQKAGYRDPTLVPEEWTNSIIAFALPEDMEVIENLVQKLDTIKTPDRETRVYPLENADALLLGTYLEQLFNQDRNQWWRRGSRNDDEEINIVTDQRLNALLITAKAADFIEIEKLIEELDVKLPESKEEPRVYPLEFANASDMADTLNDLFSDTQSGGGMWYSYVRRQSISGLSGKVKVIADRTTNSVIVIASSPRAFEVVEQLIKDLDKQSEEMGSTRVFPLQNADAESLAEILSGLFEEDSRRNQGGFFWWLMGGEEDSRPISNLIGQVKIVSDTRTNSLLVTTMQQNFPAVAKIVEDMDKLTSQVLIEVLIAEVTLEEEDELGIQWGMVDGSPGHFGVNTSGAFQYPDLESYNVPSNSGSTISDAITVAKGYQYSILSSADFNVMLNFLNTNTKMNVRASPKILTANNKEAVVKAVREVPYVKELQQQGSGLEPIASFEYRDVGLTLTVTPHVNESELVVLSIKLEQGTVLDTPTIYNLQQFSKREINTNLGVENGNTAVLAGVISETIGDTVQKVPLLGHLPIVGRALFTNKHKTNVKTELMTFLTPYILRNSDDVHNITNSQKAKLEMFKGEQLENLLNENEIRIEPVPAPVEPDSATTEEVKEKRRNSRAPQFIQGEAQ